MIKSASNIELDQNTIDNLRKLFPLDEIARKKRRKDKEKDKRRLNRTYDRKYDVSKVKRLKQDIRDRGAEWKFQRDRLRKKAELECKKCETESEDEEKYKCKKREVKSPSLS